MSTYTDFAEQMIMALYQETERTEKQYYKFGELIDRYGIESKESWIQRLADEWEYGYARDVSRFLGGSARSWDVRISAEGMRYVEEKYGSLDGVGELLRPIDAVPPNVRMTEDGTYRVTEDSTDSPRTGALFTDEASAELLPASDRLVPLDHNSRDYKEIAEGLSQLHEEIRTANNLECAPDERERLIASLSAARKLWEAAQLKVIQIKVGIIIAVQDAVDALIKVNKAVSAALLVDLIKSFVKSRIGIDL